MSRSILSLCLLLLLNFTTQGKEQRVVYSENQVSNTERMAYAAQLLKESFPGLDVQVSNKKAAPVNAEDIVLILKSQFPNYQDRLPLPEDKIISHKESYAIMRKNNGPLVISGADESGILYGVLELIDNKNLLKEPEVNVASKPEMVMRGTAIGLQKTEYLPGRDVYEYPYNEELFPWFYDKELWVEYLDMMLENKYNTLYLWNGHPFSSLVKLKDYPYALEVDEETFKKNEEAFTFLTQEANKRGIWVIQMFYNILLPKPFADKHGLKTQERNRVITPLLEDYTRKSIKAFVEKYPNVGLLVTLGEAMEGVGQDDIDWFTQTIIPGVKQGLKKLGIQEEPPIILRAHDTDAPAVMDEAQKIYKNLYTMAKYNGEALTTYEPRGSWAELHRTLSNIGTVHIQNVHILANLEPFRYNSPAFIRKSVDAMHKVYESNGVHIYPQASYWDWPYTADKADERLLQVERDWIWYKAWARYAWKVDRSPEEDVAFWSELIADYYGFEQQDAEYLLQAFDEIGEISPKILRRFGITDGNRQTSSLGMLMTQLINPFRYGLFTLLYESEAPEGEMIIDYAEKKFKGEEHIGETPIQIADEIVAHAHRAVELLSKLGKPTKNIDEFNRNLNDIYIHQALAYHYSHKVKSAIQVLEYKYTRDVASLEYALPDLEKSVQYYKLLSELTKDSYLYANSMQTKQRKIPMRGVDATFKHWTEMLPVFETEYENFKSSIEDIKKGSATVSETPDPYREETVQFEGEVELVPLKKGAKIYADQDLVVTHYDERLEGVSAIKINSQDQKINGTTLKFSASKPVKFLVGYFNSEDKVFAPKPVLEIDATANDYGQAEASIRNAFRVQYMPMVDIHAYTFPAGENVLKLPKGEALILGVISEDDLKYPYDADVDNQGNDLDELFGLFNDTKL